MRAVVQRVKFSKVSLRNKVLAEIGQGLVVLLGISQSDTEEDIDYIADKILNLRVFDDEEGKLNLSVKEIRGEILVVSQFTLYGDCRKGRRPSFVEAAGPEQAVVFYKKVVEKLTESGLIVKEGKFREKMLVEIANDGPVTILLESK
ncbi:MAG: D-aminoacyl-tRNA deacylase [Candidatus Subteraquimicrobiales bacterium]|nr:D-aminoacyl-tRNA deacylase [Candidatus Subteraquimicrobiales bacterium]